MNYYFIYNALKYNELEIRFSLSIILVTFLGVFNSASISQSINNATVAQSNTSEFLAPNGCNITVNAGPDITICTGVGKQINGVVTGGYNSITWEPSDGLSNPNIANPIANPSMTTTYTLIARGVSGNLFINGGFETGGIAPSTSGYTSYNNLTAFAMSTGGYMVMSVPQIAAQFGCNPPIGLFTMAVTPTGSGTNILCQTIACSPNTVYKIKFKCFGIPYIFGSPPVVNLKINGNNIGSIAVESGLCSQTDADFMWNSGPSTSANICFNNTGGTGPFSMFSIDDIEVRECCEEKDEIKVTVYEVIADIAMPDDINCTNSPMILDGSGSTSGPLIQYEWTTSDGNIVSGDKTNKATINKPGTYTLKVKGEFGCEKTTSIKVDGNTTPPDISASSTDIDCKNQFAKIEATSKVNPVSFEWNGPNGYNSTRASNSNIREPGDYEVTVTDDYGCKSTKKVTVGDKRTEVFASILGDTIRCGQDSIELKASSVSSRPEFTWKLRDSTFIKKPNIFVKDTGWYYLTVKDSLGCSVTDSFRVISYQTGVPIDLLGGQINCKNNTIRIQLNADTTGIVNWTGPNGFNSSDKQPIVKDSGWYFVILNTKDGCLGKDSIYISTDLSIPDLKISNPDTITCLKPSITINGSSNTPNAKITWIGPLGALGNNNSYSVIDSGEYAFIVEGINGCLNSSKIKILTIQDTPVLNLKNDTLDCLKRSTQIVISNDSTSRYDWSGPGGFTSNQRIITIDKPGEYHITAISKNGCPKFGIINIFENLSSLNASINPPKELTCINSTVILSANPTSGVTYIWSTGSTQSTSNVTNPGTYTVTITDLNNICSGTAQVVVAENNFPPSSSAINNSPLTCTKTSADIEAFPTTGVKYLWSTGDTTRTAFTNAPGTYTVTITDPNNGCTSTATTEVIQDITPPSPASNNNGPLTCNKTSVTLNSLPVIGVLYNWNTGDTTQAFITSIPGTYTVTITNLSNGCSSTATTTINIDTISPIAIARNTGPLSCIRTSTTLIAEPSSGVTYIWNNGSTLQSNSTSNSGTYTVTVTLNSNGCTSSATTVVTNEILQQNASNDGPITCTKKSITLNAPTIINGTYKWNHGPSSQNTIVSQPGTYTVTVSDSTGCTAIATTQVTIDTTRPQVTLTADDILCNKQAFIRASNATNGSLVKWNGPNGFTSDSLVNQITSAGKYLIIVTAPNGCITLDSIVSLQKDVLPDLSIKNDTLNCIKRSLILFAESVTANVTYDWNGPNNFTSSQQNPRINIPGIYTVKIRDSNGCELSKQVIIGIDTLGPSLDLSADTLTCNRSSVPIKAGTNIQGFNIQWTGPGGFSSMFPQAIVTLAGAYTCTILNPRTQCKTTKTIEVIEDTGRIRNAILDLQDSECGMQNGSISFLSINGGSPQYQYSIDGGLNYVNSNVFANLSAGVYSLKVKDKNGCEFSQSISILSSGGLDITPLPDLDLNINDKLQLNLIVTNANNYTILWSPSDQLSCSDCVNPQLTALKDQDISVLVIDENGCRDSIIFSVKVKSEVYVFAPNSFSPNGDGINDYFYPISNIQDLKVENMSIYDRWGALIFSADNLVANQGIQGWDGLFNGNPLSPGVFAYSIKYRIGNEPKFLFGDITLIR